MPCQAFAQIRIKCDANKRKINKISILFFLFIKIESEKVSYDTINKVTDTLTQKTHQINNEFYIFSTQNKNKWGDWISMSILLSIPIRVVNVVFGLFIGQ